MTRPPVLPLPVPFPVYGLDNSYTGARWMALWNQPDYLWTVSLCHGQVEGPDSITIETLRKAPRPQKESDHFRSLPIRIDEAALHGLGGAVDSVSGKGAKARRENLMRDELQLIEIEDDNVTLRNWDEVTLDVDGQLTRAHTRQVAAHRLLAIELPEVVIAVTAPRDLDAHGLALRDVRERLADYPWPSIRGHMRPRRDPPPSPKRKELGPLYGALRDIMANAQDDETDPRELLARIEHVADHVLNVTLPSLDRTT